LLHAERVPQSVLEESHMGKTRLARFLNKQQQQITDMDEPFDPKYAAVAVLWC
jgi:hypothetical protein